MDGGGGRESSEESVIGMEAQVPEEKLQFIMFQQSLKRRHPLPPPLLRTHPHQEHKHTTGTGEELYKFGNLNIIEDNPESKRTPESPFTSILSGDDS